MSIKKVTLFEKEKNMSHDIDQWEAGRSNLPKPRLTKEDKRKAAGIFEAYSTSLAEMVCEDIFDNFHSHDRLKRGEAKEMLVKMKDHIFQRKAPEMPVTNDHGAIEEDTSNAILSYIKQQRIEDQGKDQVDENNDGATFCT